MATVIPRGDAAKAFDAVRDAIRRAEIFRGISPLVWRTDPDAPDHGNELPEGTTTVRLTPAVGDRRVLAALGRGRLQYEIDLTIAVDLRTPRDDWADDAGLWEGIADAVQTARRSGRLRAAGIHFVEAPRPGLLSLTLNTED